MDHAVQVILILHMSFVKTDQQKIIKVSGPFLEPGNDGDFELSFYKKLKNG